MRARFLALVWALFFVVACARPAQAPPAPAVQTPTPPPRALLDERFQRTWPSDPRGTAWFGGSAYTLFARQPGQFVAIRAPIADVPADVSVSGTFHKVGGPPGGGYGLIVRDQTLGAGDGVDQNGQFLVAEVGDRGEIGIWQRADSRWIDLLPWTASALVHPGGATNELKVNVTGSHLRFEVNGGRAADLEIGFSKGVVGLFVGGDMNQVVMEHLVVEASPTTTRQALGAPASAPTRAADIPAAQSRLASLAARATQDSTVMQDPAWRQEMAAAVAVVEQMTGSDAARASAQAVSGRDTQQLRTSLGGIAEDVASILDAFASDVNGQRNPLTSPHALDQAASHLDSAVKQANLALAAVEAERAASAAR